MLFKQRKKIASLVMDTVSTCIEMGMSEEETKQVTIRRVREAIGAVDWPKFMDFVLKLVMAIIAILKQLPQPAPVPAPTAPTGETSDG